MKAMLYLNDITEDDGPFSYVEKSNRWIYDDLQNIFGRAISTGSYCYTPQSRAVVFHLPKQLRISHNFGRCLLDGSEQQEMILEKKNYLLVTKVTYVSLILLVCTEEEFVNQGLELLYKY